MGLNWLSSVIGLLRAPSVLIMEREKKENTWTKGNNCSANEKKKGDGKKENICRRKIFFCVGEKTEKKNI